MCLDRIFDNFRFTRIISSRISRTTWKCTTFWRKTRRRRNMKNWSNREISSQRNWTLWQSSIKESKRTKTRCSTRSRPKTPNSSKNATCCVRKKEVSSRCSPNFNNNWKKLLKTRIPSWWNRKMSRLWARKKNSLSRSTIKPIRFNRTEKRLLKRIICLRSCWAKSSIRMRLWAKGG